MLDDLRYRIWALFHRGEVERELDEELRFHLEDQIRRNTSAGLTPQEAARLRYRISSICRAPRL